jgi:hypothetical protein
VRELGAGHTEGLSVNHRRRLVAARTTLERQTLAALFAAIRDLHNKKPLKHISGGLKGANKTREAQKRELKACWCSR